MDRTGAVGFEAKTLNLATDQWKTQAERDEEMRERRLLTIAMPAGKVLDQQMLDLITREECTWAPLRVRRQRLAEMGAANGGQGMIMNPQDVEALRARIRAGEV